MPLPKIRAGLSDWCEEGWQLLRRTPPIVFATVVFVGGLATSSSILVKGIRSSNDTITVTGASTERISSDYADWSVNIKQTGATQQSSYQKLKPAVDKTLTFLKANNIKDNEIEHGMIRSHKNQIRNPKSGVLISTTWTTTQAILIGSWDVEKISAISGKISSLIGEGVPLSINRPSYTYTKLAAKRVDMLAKATGDARKRAKAIAQEAGSNIGAITNADTGTFQITVPNSTEMSSYGSYDTSTIKKDITAVMGVTFRVE
ncbi:MAG: SIMPL domain-containing protein [Prochlorococcus sp.]|jgi:hypothetical protein